MKRLDNLKKAGYKVTAVMSGSFFATKYSITIKGTSITNLHTKIFGY